jgi:hypothetical protein
VEGFNASRDRQESEDVAPGSATCGRDELLAHFGQIDIVFDQILRGRITPQLLGPPMTQGLT